MSLGNDVIIDPWYPMGKADLIDAAHLALHFTYMSGREEITEMLRLATERARGRSASRMSTGSRRESPPTASSSSATTPIDVISLRATRRYVVRRGRVIAETTPARTTLLGDPLNFAVAGGR